MKEGRNANTNAGVGMMRKRVQIMIAVFAAVMLALVGWQIFELGEPVSQGKPLSVWLVQYGTNHWSAARDGQLDKQAETAIRQIGSKAIPICLRRMNTKT